jgi:hypothetical protein
LITGHAGYRSGHAIGVVEGAMNPIIIDVEASGFGRGSYPVEVGVALPDGTRHCYLISPARSWKAWDEEAEKVHGISRETLLSYGRPLQDVAWRLNELLRNKTVYCDAWSFDMSWLGKLYEAANMRQTFRLADIVELMDEEQRNRWHRVKRQVMNELGLRRHRASGDAQILQETWRRLNQRAA